MIDGQAGSGRAGSPMPRAAHTLLLAALLVLGAVLGGKSITDENTIAARGDSARYLMNGVFLYDALREAPAPTPSSLLDYAQRYFARYPALSLGHHPMLLPVAEAAAFPVFGVAVSTARLVLVVFFLAAVMWSHALFRELIGDAAALVATTLLVTNPLMVYFARSILSEMPAVTFCAAACYYMVKYGRTQRRLDLALLTASIVLALYAKQLTAFLAPLAAVHIGLTLGWRHLFSRPLLVAAVAGALAIVPVAVMTLVLSPFNVELAMGVARGGGLPDPGVPALLWMTLRDQWLGIIGVVAGVVLVFGLLRRQRWAAFFGCWVGLVFLQIYWFTSVISPERYAIYWVPAICGLAACALVLTPHRVARAALAGVLLAVAGYYAVTTMQRPAPASAGYDEAAAYIVDAGKGDSVLFSGPLDTGLFVFGVRKRDPDRRWIVLRADKLLTTSKLFMTVEDREVTPEEIHELLHRFGTAFVVVEDVPSESAALEALRQEVRSPRFAERRRIVVQSTYPDLDGVPIVIYEYLAATRADPAAPLNMDLPLVGRSIQLTVGDLLDARPR